MKLFGVLCVQGIRAQETTDQCEETDLSANYCRTRGKTLDNDKVNVSIKFLFNNFQLYNDAINRYREQEAEFNFLGQCYNQVKAWGKERRENKEKKKKNS